MGKKEFDTNTSQEVDLISLMEYFKRGIKGFIHLLLIPLKWILSLVQIAIKLSLSNPLITISSIVVFTAFSFLVPVLFPKHQYEMVVSPNYNSVHELYSVVENIQLNGKKLYGITKAKIEPIKTLKDEIDVYYGVVSDDWDVNSADKFRNLRDTVFLREFKIKDFVGKIADKEYKKHKITLVSPTPRKPKELQDLIEKPLENNPIFKQLVKANMRSIDVKNQYNEAALTRIDSLLRQLRTKNTNPNNLSVLNLGEGKTNVERDLLNEYERISNEISTSLVKKQLYGSVLFVVSPMQEVPPDGLLYKPWYYFLFYGLLFAILLLWAKENLPSLVKKLSK